MEKPLEPIPKYKSRQPVDLFKARSGVCYDRSRTFDKLFQWCGFETRHIYVMYSKHPITGEHLSFWRAFFTKGIQTKLLLLTQISGKIFISRSARHQKD